jgi:serine/threonine protein kinase
VWALGCVLHELATGQTAFRDDWLVKSYTESAEELSISLSQLPPFLQHHVRCNIRELLHRNYLQRPSASSALEGFQSYCRFLDLPDVHEFVNAEKFPEYRVWKTLTLNQRWDDLTIEILTDAFGPTQDHHPPITEAAPAEIDRKSTSWLQTCLTAESSRFREVILTALIQEPMNFWLWYQISLMCIVRKEFNEGIAICKQGKIRYLGNPFPAMALNCIYAASGQFSRAVEVYMEALEGMDETDVWRDISDQSQINTYFTLLDKTADFDDMKQEMKYNIF